jgi:hypothetical protein
MLGMQQLYLVLYSIVGSVSVHLVTLFYVTTADEASKQECLATCRQKVSWNSYTDRSAKGIPVGELTLSLYMTAIGKVRP